jgi:hypothetical protein
MKNLVRQHAIVLAALLQVLPIVRNFVTNPAATSTFAIILRWTIGSSAALGVVDAVSGATSAFTTPSTFSGTGGIFFSNNVTVSISGGNSAAADDYFFLQSGSTTSALLSNGQSTTVTLPPGLTFKSSWVNGASTIGGIIFGTPTTAGSYPTTVTVVSPGNAVLSQNITITITGSAAANAPVFTNQPASLTNLVSSNATFTVTAGGTAPLRYQWFFNTNTALLNATNASLTLTNIQLTNAGYYLVRVTNSAGSSNSLNALLTVWQPPVITNQPVNVTNVAGGSASFSVVAGGTPAVSYQWKFNTNTALLNATTAAFNLANVRASQAGTYSVVITNSAGSLTSAPAILFVTTPAAPPMTTPAIVAGKFQFTFNPVIGLTNSVVTNNTMNGGSWVVMTNVPPPATTNPVTVSDNISGTNRFYRVQIIP